MGGYAKAVLLGAGPGDPELLTLKGVRALRQADVVLYDALVHPDLLEHCRPDAERIFVGKRAGKPSARQGRIHQQMAEAVRAGKLVVRLKGGDPYLFGRGSEEAEFLAAQGIPFEVIPGVPSPLAATAYAGISLTHRNLASSVAYVTATESAAKDRSSHDWAKLATATQTLVIFMGLRRLRQLMDLLMEHGRPHDTPAAVIQSASLPEQRVVVGTVGDLAERAENAGMHMPALIVVGQVVTLRETLRWYDNRPLFGKRILVTRPASQAGELSQRLRNEGALPIEIPLIRIGPPSTPEPLNQSIAQIERYDWIVFTSRNGVEAFFDALGKLGKDARALGGAQLCTIGPSTAKALEHYGVFADLVPDEYRAEAIAASLLGLDRRPSHVLLPRAAVAREVLPDLLRAAGVNVDVVEAYRTLGLLDEDRRRLRACFDAGEIDTVALTSSSTVTQLLEAIGGNRKWLDKVTLASIGPITTKTALDHGLRIDVTAERYTIEGLVDALARHARNPPSTS